MEFFRAILSPTPRDLEIPNHPPLERPAVRQPACKLLELPAEIRLVVYSYMNLSPDSSECLEWLGGYFACRHLHLEMRDALKPEDGLNDTTALTCIGRVPHTASFVEIDRSHDAFRLLYVVTLKLPLSQSGLCCVETLVQLYVVIYEYMVRSVRLTCYPRIQV
jgi:hypothetical protein